LGMGGALSEWRLLVEQWDSGPLHYYDVLLV
jgi:hypothetical protein